MEMDERMIGEELTRTVAALRKLRAPLLPGEMDLHRLIEERLTEEGIPFIHEARLQPGCRIDFLCGSVGIETKRGRPERGKILRQLQRYAGCEPVDALVLVTERTVLLPDRIGGKPLRTVCLNRLWGIAL